MDLERWPLIQDLFASAAKLSPSEQRTFVEANAGGDTELATILLSMLRRDRESSFLDDGSAALGNDLGSETFPASLGPYKRKGCIGFGGMGVVYLAEHEEWGIPVAIKVPGDTWISPEHKGRFFAEQRLLAQLTHPGIARIYEAGTRPDGTPWFAMEYVKGEPITVLARTQNLSIEERLSLFRQACEAVQYAHSQAIIHRDLKPSNIFVTDTRQVKLLDFGIAKQLEAEGFNATRTGSHPLTVAYAAPEQLSANRISIQSDIYSLGVTLYELLTGSLPIDVSGLSSSQAEQLVVSKVPERPSAISALPLKRTAWADLDLLVLKCLHKDVSQRYKSADALIRDIDHFLAQEPLDARPDSFLYRLQKFLQRRRVPVTASLFTIFLLGSVVVYFTWKLARSRDEAVAQTKRETQIQRFMTDLLEGGDHVNGPSKDLRVVDLLGVATAEAHQFDGEPLVQGDLYKTLGGAYRSLGEFDRAESLFRIALARFTSQGAAGHYEAADVLILIGQVQLDKGQYTQSEATLRSTLASLNTRRPRPVVQIARCKEALADALIHESRYLEALTLLKDAEQVERSTSDNSDNFMNVLNLESTADVQLRRFPEAERVTRYLIDVDRKHHSRLTPDDAADIMNLGQIEEGQLRYAAAEPYYREALKILESWFPENHPEVANTKRMLAQDLEILGKNEEATILAKETLADLEHAYGPAHRRVAYMLRVLYKLAYKRHDLDAAHAYASREVSIYRQIGNTADLPAALSNVADIDVAQHHPRAAEPLYEEAIRRFPSTEYAGSLIFAHAQLALGRLRNDEKRYSEAASLLGQSLALWRKQPVFQKQRTIDTLGALAVASDGMGKHQEAAAYRREAEAISH